MACQLFGLFAGIAADNDGDASRTLQLMNFFRETMFPDPRSLTLSETLAPVSGNFWRHPWLKTKAKSN